MSKSLRPSGASLVDEQSRRTIEERLDVNILVEAGAGSGKTHSLANRMAAGIASGRYEVEHLAAVTFTRKAAAELRGRFQLALETRLPRAGGDERARIERALAGLEHLFAGTIHSFCAHLLRERPVEAGVAPGFSELDELDDEEARKRAWRDYLSLLRGRDSSLLDDLQRARVSAKDLDRAFATVCTFDEVDFPPGDAREPDAAPARAAAEAFWRKLEALMPKAVDPGHKCAALDRASQFRGLLRRAGSGRPGGLAEALQCWENPPKVTMKWWAEDRERQRVVRAAVEELAADFQEATVQPFLTAWRHYVYRLAMTLLLDARAFAREERRRALALNFGDLLSAARALLRDNPRVRAALQQKYRWLLVDEFQDTDPIQAEVMLLLAADEGEGGSAPGPVDPYAVRLRPGALFVVGDPKQSIYRFRRADIDIYNRVRETIRANGGQVLPLTTSFRARPALCEWNNEVFSQLLPQDATPQQAAFTRLDPDPAWTPRRPSPKRESGLRTIAIPEEIAKGRVASADAEVIARYIRMEVDAGRASYADFLVLTRKKKQLATYAAALQSLQVPVEVSGAGAFGGSPIVLALVGLLRALADPADGLAVVGVLRGPLFGVSDRQLFEHRQGGGYFTVSGARRDDDARPASPVEEALARMGGFLRLTRSLPLAAALEQVLEEAGFLALAASVEDAGPAPAGDVLHGVDLVRAVAERGGSLAAAVDVLERAAGSSEAESVPLEPGRRDVVRVMNLHKAKGLEARVVFLADPAGGARKSADVRIVRDGAAARGYLALQKDVGEHATQVIAHPEGWDEHEAAEMAYVLAEETRLLYVAATRARELLIVSRWEKEGNGGRPWAALDDFLLQAPELEVKGPTPVTSGTTVDLSPAARARAAEERERRRDEAERASWELAAGRAESGDSPVGQSAVGRGFSPAGQAHRPDAGTAWGTLLHGLLEYAGGTRTRGARTSSVSPAGSPWRTPTSLPSSPARWTSSSECGSRRSGRRCGPVARRCSRCRSRCGSPPGNRAVAPTAGPVPMILQGVIDLVHRAGDGWRILDYKTDLAADDEAALAARHAGQLATYTAAWERATGATVTGSAIVALRTLRVVSTGGR